MQGHKFYEVNDNDFLAFFIIIINSFLLQDKRAGSLIKFKIIMLSVIERIQIVSISGLLPLFYPRKQMGDRIRT